MKTKSVRLTRPGSNPVRDSDRRIQSAIQTLEASHRGQQVLKDLARLFHGPASGLDLGNMSAVVCLVREFAMGSRRGFIPETKATHVGHTLPRYQVYRDSEPYRVGVSC